MPPLSAGTTGQALSGGLLLLRRRAGGYANKVLSIQRANLLAYWRLAETSGTTILDSSGNARNGAYTGVDLGQTGIGDGGTAPLFDGVNDYGNVYSTSLRDAFNGQEGTVALWAKVANSGVWADSQNRTLFRAEADASNFIWITKTVGANTVLLRYSAGGTAESVNVGTSAATTWLHFALTWSKSADQVKAYLAGAQSGVTQVTLGAWAGSLTLAALGAQTLAPAAVWSGWIAHPAIWNTPLSAADIARLAVL